MIVACDERCASALRISSVVPKLNPFAVLTDIYRLRSSSAVRLVEECRDDCVPVAQEIRCDVQLREEC